MKGKQTKTTNKESPASQNKPGSRRRSEPPRGPQAPLSNTFQKPADDNNMRATNWESPSGLFQCSWSRANMIWSLRWCAELPTPVWRHASCSHLLVDNGCRWGTFVSSFIGAERHSYWPGATHGVVPLRWIQDVMSVKDNVTRYLDANR